MATKRQYQNVARQLNRELPYGKVSVVDTAGYGIYCDKWSLRLDDDVYDMLYEMQDKKTANIMMDELYTADGQKFYLEPYTSRLHNLAVI